MDYHLDKRVFPVRLVFERPEVQVGELADDADVVAEAVLDEAIEELTDVVILESVGLDSSVNWVPRRPSEGPEGCWEVR